MRSNALKIYPQAPLPALFAPVALILRGQSCSSSVTLLSPPDRTGFGMFLPWLHTTTLACLPPYHIFVTFFSYHKAMYERWTQKKWKFTPDETGYIRFLLSNSPWYLIYSVHLVLEMDSCHWVERRKKCQDVGGVGEQYELCRVQ